jgi:hypothetical protein
MTRRLPWLTVQRDSGELIGGGQLQDGKWTALTPPADPARSRLLAIGAPGRLALVIRRKATFRRGGILEPVNFKCPDCGSTEFVNRRQISESASVSPDKSREREPTCARCLQDLVDLQTYARKIADVATTVALNDSGGERYLHAASPHGAIELLYTGSALKVRVEYYGSGARNIVKANSYVRKSDALRDVRSWLSGGDP